MSKHAIIFALALIGLAIAGPTTAAEPTKIRFVTDWKAQAPQGGFYQPRRSGSMPSRGWMSRSFRAAPR